MVEKVQQIWEQIVSIGLHLVQNSCTPKFGRDDTFLILTLIFQLPIVTARVFTLKVENPTSRGNAVQ